MKRYFVIDPAPGGDEWFRVADREAAKEHNDSGYVADFFEKMPNAKAEAYGLCDRLNAGVTG